MITYLQYSLFLIGTLMVRCLTSRILHQFCSSSSSSSLAGTSCRPGSAVAVSDSLAGASCGSTSSNCRGAVAAIQERSVAPAAAVAAILERYRGLVAEVAASGSVARPVTEAQGVAEAGSAAVAAIGDVAWDAAPSRSPARPRPKHYYSRYIDK